MRPTRSWLVMAEKARTAATSAMRSRLSWVVEPKRLEAEMSTSSMTVSSRSSVNF